LNPVEEEAGYSPTIIEDVKNNMGLIIADDIYRQEPMFVSAFTLIVRNFYYAATIDASDLTDYCNKLASKKIHNTQVDQIQRSYNMDLSLIKLLLLNMKVLTTDDKIFTKRMKDSGGAAYIHSTAGFFSTLYYLSKKYTGEVARYKRLGYTERPQSKYVTHFLIQKDKMREVLQIGEAV
jgi:hypothetical protein